MEGEGSEDANLAPGQDGALKNMGSAQTPKDIKDGLGAVLTCVSHVQAQHPSHPWGPS